MLEIIKQEYKQSLMIDKIENFYYYKKIQQDVEDLIAIIILHK